MSSILGAHKDVEELEVSSLRTGVIFCSCNNTIKLNFERLKQIIQERYHPDTIILNNTLCIGKEKEKLLKILKEQYYTGILIAACSENIFQGIFPRKSTIPSDTCLEVVDLQEECKPHSSELGLIKAVSMIGASLFKLEKLKPLNKIQQEIKAPVAVIGNGLSLLKVVENLSDLGIHVTAISPGTVEETTHPEAGTIKYTGTRAKLKQKFQKAKKVEILEQVDDINVSGRIGDFQVQARRGGEITTHTAGLLVFASDGDEYKPFDLSQHGYGRFKQVKTLGEIIGEFQENTALQGQNIIIANCIGSRDETLGRPYCSAYCCDQGIRLARELTQKGANVTICYMADVRSLFFNEEEYRKARMEGVEFLRAGLGDVDADTGSGRLKVTIEDTLSGQILEKCADQVVLSCALLASPFLRDVGQRLKLEIKEGGFLKELYSKLKATETKLPGVFVCESVVQPLPLTETLKSADAVAFKVLKSLQTEYLRTNTTAQVDKDLCVGCELCVKHCPRQAITTIVIDDQLKVEVDPTICQGCALCQTLCLTGAIQLANYEDEALIGQIKVAIDAWKSLTSSPLIMNIACRECGYCAIEHGHLSGIEMPEHTITIQVPCAARVSPLDLLTILDLGADAVLVISCPEENCHMQEGSHTARLHVHFVKNILQQIGQNPNRVDIVQLCAAEANKYASKLKALEATLEGS
ncbi:MAG: hydrogenase iron-sulfur subunit [Candidatus Heimdallarchaeota archaeon]